VETASVAAGKIKGTMSFLAQPCIVLNCIGIMLRRVKIKDKRVKIKDAMRDERASSR
jgi:hypothetical protein